MGRDISVYGMMYKINSITESNQISDKPNRPNGPIEVVDIRAEKATVKWQKPDDWKGSDITGYTLEKMDMVRNCQINY